MKIARLPCELVPEDKAVIFSYIQTHQNAIRALPEPQTVTVLFFDMGHSKTSVSIGQFGANGYKRLRAMVEPNLGGRDLDNACMKYVSEKFQEEYGCEDNPASILRCRLRMLEAIEKARKNLSGDTSAYIEIDNLLQDETLEEEFERQKFEELIQASVQKLDDFL